MSAFKELTAKQYYELWESNKVTRKKMATRQDYYDGKHIIVNSNAESVDGTSKSERVANFIKYGIDMYVGSISGEPYNVTALEVDGEDNSESPAKYSEIGKANNFDVSDVANAKNAYIMGYGVETHEFDSDTGAYAITPQDPLTFMPVWDSDGTMLGAIHMSEIVAGKFYQNELLSNGIMIMIVYTDDSITTYTKTKDKNNGEWSGNEPITHGFGRTPIVLWRINETFESHITDDLIGQQDEYNEIDSCSGDDIRYDSDGLLAIEGYDIAQVQELAPMIREYKVFPVPQGGSVKFVKKDTDFSRTDARLRRTRQHIFMALGVPDIEEIVGATGDTSGIALGLKFKPMQDSAKTMIAYLRSGVRDRIDMINSIMDNDIDGVQVNIEFDLPVNRIEEWQNIGSVTGIVSHTKQLEMLSDVYDPAQELKRIAREKEDTRFIDRTSGTVEEVVARNDADIRDKAITLAPQIDTMIQTITDAVMNKVLADTAGTKQTPASE
jgi:SPP1 family phage portal protein